MYEWEPVQTGGSDYPQKSFVNEREAGLDAVRAL